MKIIGQAEDRKFLVSADEDELSQLTGHHSAWNRENSGKKKLKIGDEINVNDLYTHSAHMRTVRAEIDRAKGILDTVSGGLTLADNVIQKAMDKKDENTL